MFARSAPFIFVCLWATGFVGARLGMPYSEPGTFLAVRFSAAFALLVFFALILRAPWPGLRSAVHCVLIGMFIHGIYLGSVFWAIDRGMPAGVCAVVVGLQPLFTALLAGGLLKETISGRHWIGIAIGMIGVVLVLYPRLDLDNSGVNVATIWVTVLGMASVSIGTILQKRLANELPLRSSTALQYLGAFFPVFLLALASETGTIFWTGEMIVAMVWSVVVLSFGAIFLLMWLIRQGSVAKVSSLFFLVPAVAALMSYYLFDEQLSPLQLAGMALCAVAVALASAATKQATTVKTPLR